MEKDFQEMNWKSVFQRFVDIHLFVDPLWLFHFLLLTFFHRIYFNCDWGLFMKGSYNSMLNKRTQIVEWITYIQWIYIFSKISSVMSVVENGYIKDTLTTVVIIKIRKSCNIGSFFSLTKIPFTFPFWQCKVFIKIHFFFVVLCWQHQFCRVFFPGGSSCGSVRGFESLSKWFGSMANNHPFLTFEKSTPIGRFIWP